MSEAPPPPPQPAGLDEMLDDALQDYERLEASQPPTAAPTQQQQQQQQQQQRALFPPSEEDVEATFNEVLARLSKVEPAAVATTAAAAQPPQPPTADATAAATAADAAATEAVERYVSALASTTAEADDGTSAEAVVQLLRPFVSKEMLYPPLNELRRLFPAWLERQKGVLPAQELAERQQQYECLQRVCQLYESQQTPEDHIQEIVVLVERMGQAPKELVAEASAIAAAAAPSPSPTSDADGSTSQQLPPDCSVM